MHLNICNLWESAEVKESRSLTHLNFQECLYIKQVIAFMVHASMILEKEPDLKGSMYLKRSLHKRIEAGWHYRLIGME